MLAQRGGTVVLGCRDERKAGQAASEIRAAAPGADVRLVHLDLASLGSVRQAADEILADCPRLDLLINNAGVMYVPYQRTEDGFELTFGTNHLGHFALTGLLLPRLLATPGARVVTVSSVAHRYGKMHFDDLMLTSDYQPDPAYGQSKLANLLFSYELQARLAAAGAGTASLAAHPGVVLTDLWRTSPGWQRALISPRLRLINFWTAQACVTRGAAHAACRHRPSRPGRRVLRARRVPRVHRQSGAGGVHCRLARPGRAAAAVGYLGAAHRRPLLDHGLAGGPARIR